MRKILIFMVVMFALPLAYAVDGSLEDVSCQNNPNFNINEKEYCMAQIPLNYSSESFKCLSYVVLDGEIIQTNPEYKERSSSIFQIGEEDTREYFEPANHIVNIYYTRKNLYPDYKYTINIVCHSTQTRLSGNATVMIDYENLDIVFTRTEWAKRNVAYLVAGMVLFIFIIGFLAWIVTGTWKVSS